VRQNDIITAAPKVGLMFSVHVCKCMPGALNISISKGLATFWTALLSKRAYLTLFLRLAAYNYFSSIPQL